MHASWFLRSSPGLLFFPGAKLFDLATRMPRRADIRALSNAARACVHQAIALARYAGDRPFWIETGGTKRFRYPVALPGIAAPANHDLIMSAARTADRFQRFGEGRAACAFRGDQDGDADQIIVCPVLAQSAMNP